ncbi:MAG: thiamine phosphate synthase [Alphaproteobacteria bacterium]|uniref:Thiamine-phosphate synthase n=1 Tax=Candidatus Nitrobium versatile TaxID=2884831 RepID=A0A953M0T5_9BACT|nr:thiamine phosphate synthase [Candidatus Nitrobium versatile]
MDFTLYLITDSSLFGDRDAMLKVVGAALEGGVRAVQLREKGLHTRELLVLAYRMRALTARHRARLFINDRFDIALCVGADGVHLGQASLPGHAVRKAVGDRLLIGVSTHSREEALEAERGGADFITFGPLYPTPAKLRYGEPVGVEALKKARAEVNLPIFGLGGIKLHHCPEVREAGAHGVALISGILAEADPKKAAEKYLGCVCRLSS